ncbi:hypothetical protein Pmani_011920 [Petrolisthes manimaculis]|uniref:Cadherin domain-containing protein n=1 Tax=Petrolisthes manimaculis TaxID=1843537 RepID=A0AAE1PY94_9EUCA|nr:hypothetical protein Pmani_011920 [Petrolisthes manimaculis]
MVKEKRERRRRTEERRRGNGEREKEEKREGEEGMVKNRGNKKRGKEKEKRGKKNENRGREKKEWGRRNLCCCGGYNLGPPGLLSVEFITAANKYNGNCKRLVDGTEGQQQQQQQQQQQKQELHHNTTYPHHHHHHHHHQFQKHTTTNTPEAFNTSLSDYSLWGCGEEQQCLKAIERRRQDMNMKHKLRKRKEMTRSNQEGRETRSNQEGRETRSNQKGRETRSNQEGRDTRSNQEGRDTRSNQEGRETRSNQEGRETRSNQEGRETRSNQKGRETRSNQEGRETRVKLRETNHEFWDRSKAGMSTPREERREKKRQELLHGIIALDVRVTGAGEGIVSFSLSDHHNFGIDEGGVIYNLRLLDYEMTGGYYVVQVTAELQGGSGGSSGGNGHTWWHKPVATANIHVKDAPEDPYFTADSYQFVISEFAPKGSYVGRVSANDDDEDLDYYFLDNVEPSDMFNINSVSGVVTVGRPPGGTLWDYSFMAGAVDARGQVALAPVTVSTSG